MKTTTANRSGRAKISEVAERKFEGYMLWANKPVRKIGQESWLPAWIHQKIRFVNDDESIETIRHFPDFDTGRALVQVKSAPNESEYPTVTLEESSYTVSKRLALLGVPVLVLWLFSDGKSFYGQWADEITPIMPDTPREDTGGSHTPYVLVRKDDLLPISHFWDRL